MTLPSRASSGTRARRWLATSVVLAAAVLLLLLLWAIVTTVRGANDSVGAAHGPQTQGWDAIVIPGGGSQRGATAETLPLHVRRRLDRTLELLCAKAAAPQPYVIVLSAGTVHQPNYISANGWPVLESTSSAQYLLDRAASAAATAAAGNESGGCGALDPSRVLRETTSLDTVGNAFFTRAQHTDVLGLRRLHVVTSAFHLRRTRHIFEFVFACARDEDRRNDFGRRGGYTLSFEGVSDVGLPADVLAARRKREAASLRALRRTLSDRFGIRDDLAVAAVGDDDNDDDGDLQRLREAARRVPLSAVHRWLFGAHDAYRSRAAGMTPLAAPSVDADTLGTY